MLNILKSIFSIATGTNWFGVVSTIKMLAAFYNQVSLMIKKMKSDSAKKKIDKAKEKLNDADQIKDDDERLKKKADALAEMEGRSDVSGPGAS